MGQPKEQQQSAIAQSNCNDKVKKHKKNKKLCKNYIICVLYSQ